MEVPELDQVDDVGDVGVEVDLATGQVRTIPSPASVTGQTSSPWPAAGWPPAARTNDPAKRRRQERQSSSRNVVSLRVAVEP